MFGLFRNRKKDKEPEKDPLPWKNLTTEAQLDVLVKESHERPVFIFKHSTRCGISSMVLSRFESELGSNDDYGMYYLDLLAIDQYQIRWPSVFRCGIRVRNLL